MTRRFLMVLSLLGAATAAQAHAHLEEATPADKSRVAAPAAVELKFNEDVKLTSLTLQHGKESAQPLKPLPDKASATLSVPLPALAAGDYVVAWRVASDDGHVMSGKLDFTVDPAAKPAAPGSNHAMHDGEHMGDHADHMDHMDHADSAKPDTHDQHQH
jgi:methionine-rich copper-binding protein CopC